MCVYMIPYPGKIASRETEIHFIAPLSRGFPGKVADGPRIRDMKGDGVAIHLRKKGTSLAISFHRQLLTS